MSVMLANTMATSILTVAEEYSSPAATSLRSSHPPFQNRQKIVILIFEGTCFEGKCARWVSQGGVESCDRSRLQSPCPHPW